MNKDYIIELEQDNLDENETGTSTRQGLQLTAGRMHIKSSDHAWVVQHSTGM